MKVRSTAKYVLGCIRTDELMILKGNIVVKTLELYFKNGITHLNPYSIFRCDFLLIPFSKVEEFDNL
jgi:hypothetical protein